MRLCQALASRIQSQLGSLETPNTSCVTVEESDYMVSAYVVVYQKGLMNEGFLVCVCACVYACVQIYELVPMLIWR